MYMFLDIISAIGCFIILVLIYKLYKDFENDIDKRRFVQYNTYIIINKGEIYYELYRLQGFV